MIKAILFDFDDTLGNREFAAYNLYRNLLKPYFSDELLLEAAMQDIMVADQYSNVKKDLTQTQIEERYKVKFEFSLKKIWDDLIGDYSVAFDDTVETLEYLKGKYLLGVVTNGSISTQNRKVEKAGIMEYFDLILTSEEAGVVKPDSKIFQIAAERLKVDVSECVYVGDIFSNDIRGALNAGMDAIWIWKRGPRLCTYDVKRIENLSELKEMF